MWGGRSGSEKSGIKVLLCIAEDLVGGAETAGSVQVVADGLASHALQVAVQAGQELLAVRVPNRDGTDAGADDAEGRLVEEHEQGF